MEGKMQVNIIYTCPECGADLQEICLTSNPPQFEKYCPTCGWTQITPTQSKTIRIPYNNTVPNNCKGYSNTEQVLKKEN